PSCSLRPRGQRGLQGTAHDAAIGPLQEKLDSVLAFETAERCRCGTEHAKSLLSGSKDSNELRGILHRRVERPRSHDGVDQADGWRIPHRLPELDLFPVEREVVLTAGVADAVVVREQRLHDGLAPYLTSTRAARDLRKQLKRPLAGAKIRQAQADI